jgi:hypothetical protein
MIGGIGNVGIMLSSLRAAIRPERSQGVTGHLAFDRMSRFVIGCSSVSTRCQLCVVAQTSGSM